jgi:hypothetical protein
VIVEVWQPKERWHALSAEEKRAFLDHIAASANAARETGTEIIGWGALERGVSNPAEYGFCGVFFVDDREALYVVDKAIREAGWYQYFDHFNVAAELHGRDGVDAAAVLCRLLGVRS